MPSIDRVTENRVAHTPGPWRLVASYQPQSGGIQTTAFAPYVVDASGRHVAAAMIGGFDDTDFGQVEANARLIAAAPELFAALKRVSTEITLNGLNAAPDQLARDAYIRLMVDVRCVIQKAEGR